MILKICTDIVVVAATLFALSLMLDIATIISVETRDRIAESKKKKEKEKEGE